MFPLFNGRIRSFSDGGRPSLLRYESLHCSRLELLCDLGHGHIEVILGILMTGVVLRQDNE